MPIKPATSRLQQKTIRQLLRKNQTNAEAILWQYLRRKELGEKFVRQFGIENYVVDFCCRSQKLIIEVDGEIHNKEDIIKNDLQRTKDLKSFGYKIIRFKNEEVLQNIYHVLDEIRRFL